MTNAEIKAEIANLEKRAANPNLPASAVAALNKKVADLKSKLSSEDDKKKAEPKPKPEPKPKAEKPKREPKPKAESKPKSEAKGDKDEYDCDDLIAKAKERKRKAKAAAEKRKDAPKKSQATKNKEAVEKTSKRVEANVEKRAKKGDITVAEIEKLIAEYESAITKLRELLKKAKSEKKMALGGNLGMDYSSAVGKITSDACKCGDKYANGGKVKPKMVRSQFEEEEYEYAVGGNIKQIYVSKQDLMSSMKRRMSAKSEEDWSEAIDRELTHTINGKKYFAIGYNTRSKGRVYTKDQALKIARRLQKKYRNKENFDVIIKEISGNYGVMNSKKYEYGQEVTRWLVLTSPNMMMDTNALQLLEMGNMAEGGEINEMGQGGDVSADRKYSAMKAGRRIGKKVSKIAMSDGSKFKRRNMNQYGQAGGGEYYESRRNRTDKRKTL
jgi:hypothetical protein